MTLLSVDPLATNLANRKWLLARLRGEIVGPEPVGAPHQFSQKPSFTWDEFRRPKTQHNGEEVIWQDPPTKRYGAGILFPIGVLAEPELPGNEDASAREENDPGDHQDVDEKLERNAEKRAARRPPAMEESEDYAVTLANAFRPSAIGISFLADFSKERKGLRVEVVNVGRLGSDDMQETASASYKQVKPIVGDPDGKQSLRSMWLRIPLLDETSKLPFIDVSAEELLAATAPIRKMLVAGEGLQIVLVCRGGYSQLTPTQRLITVSLVNRQQQSDAGNLDEQCLFQAGIRVKGQSGLGWICPYPDTEISKLGEINPLSDERINQLLYRQYQTFGIGHGCAADWAGERLSIAKEIWTDVMPSYETPSTSADLFVQDREGVSQSVKVSMRKLAGYDSKDDGNGEIAALVAAYRAWIGTLKTERPEVSCIPNEMKDTAAGLIERCEACLARIEDGIRFLSEDTEVARAANVAFSLANRAMLIAQLRTTRVMREPSLGAQGQGVVWSPPISNPDPAIPDERRGYWRAFQIACLLMSLRGIAEPNSKDREIVDLIWFPTGGGKTEAYLGLTAFTIFFHRLIGRESGGAEVLMRYTLRLLTAQQFQRAAILFCAMENIRQATPGLGAKPFRIGLWVGGSTSPNSRKDAISALQNLQRNSDSENPFVLLKCPWCGAKFGPSAGEGSDRHRDYRRGGAAQRSDLRLPSVLGYSTYRNAPNAEATVVFRCNDPACDFGVASTLQSVRPPLPIVVIDEDLLEDPPSLVIGTVDKFAMLAWKPEARRLFGIGDAGEHIGLPPTLIIQDELHLISGPLGSMVGAYETVVERLCKRDDYAGTKPKIIASTATISRASEQIRSLYAREDVFLFPPSGFEAGDSFFARDAKREDGTLKPGRIYVGVLASAHGSFQTTQARVFACLMQHAATMNTNALGRDPWWTLLCFFNSLRELGGAASLFVSDARDYLRVILDRQGIKYEQIRKLYNVSELTSRIRSDQVPKELERLERTLRIPTDDDKTITREADVVDACLASNIIEVGVDVSRLGLMAVVGQPKTTSQYIQVSSRVGRDPEKPGLVAVLYGPSKPRDRSHFERFRPYHQRLYAQVEPTSVTPFSPPAVERALHGVLVAAVRQFANRSLAASFPNPFPLAEGTALLDLVKEMFEERVNIVAPQERLEVMLKLQRRLDQWRSWQPATYGTWGAAPADPPLLHPAGSTELPAWNGRSWPTMSSLRNVDASCEAEVTSFFNQSPGDVS